MLRVIPGDPARLIGTSVGQTDLLRIREELGLERPLGVQFVSFLGEVIRGDFGNSYYFVGEEGGVFGLIFEKLPNTMALAGVAIGIALALALPLGFIAGTRRDSVADRASLGLAVAFQSMPGFWVGLMLIWLVAIQRNLLPATGYQGVRSLILPAIALALPLVAVLSRTIRAVLGDTLEREYVVALTARGVPYRRVTVAHGSRAVAVPLVTVLGVSLGYLLGAAVVIEFLFDFPGVGLQTLNAVVRRDYPLIQGTVLALSAIFVLTNLLVDILYVYLDPRIRRQVSRT